MVTRPAGTLHEVALVQPFGWCFVTETKLQIIREAAIRNDTYIEGVEWPDVGVPTPQTRGRFLLTWFVIVPVRVGGGITDQWTLEMGSKDDAVALIAAIENARGRALGPRPGEKAAQPVPTSDIPGDIRNLASLRDDGLITEAEFQSKKAELLSRM